MGLRLGTVRPREGQIDERRARRLVFGASFVAYLISANIAWLNPAPDFEVYRTGPVPVLWQYNPDAGIELVSAAWFPDAYRTYPERISRPGYPVVIHGLSLVIERLAQPVRALSRLEATGIAYALVKLVATVLAGQAALAVLRRRLTLEAATLGAVLLTLHWHILEYAAAFHTADLQLTGTVFVVWIAMRLVERERSRAAAGTAPTRRGRVDALLGGSLVGLLLLVKTTLVAPLAVLAVLVLRRRFLVAAVATLGAVWPSIAYQAYLRVIGIGYVSWEVEAYGQGVWVLDSLRDPFGLLSEVWLLLAAIPGETSAFFGPVLIPALFALLMWRKRLFAHGDQLFVTLAAVAAVFQFIAVRREVPYMTADLGIVVFGAASLAVIDARDRVVRRSGGAGSVLTKALRPRALLAGVTALWIMFGVVTLANFPLVPPSEQLTRDSEVLENRRDILENPDRYSDEARERARGGIIVDPDRD